MLGKTEGKRMRWLDDITDYMDMSLSRLRQTLKDKEACGLWSMGSQRVGHELTTATRFLLPPPNDQARNLCIIHPWLPLSFMAHIALPSSSVD